MSVNLLIIKHFRGNKFPLKCYLVSSVTDEIELNSSISCVASRQPKADETSPWI